MAALRLTSTPQGVRAIATSPLTCQLWPPSANAKTREHAPKAPQRPSSAAAAVAVAATATALSTAPSQSSLVLARHRPMEVELPSSRYFNPSDTVLSSTGGKPGMEPDRNKANLGKSESSRFVLVTASSKLTSTALRILQDHLPSVLQSPLPQEILAPNISLHLFPTTHPHLPTVSGRVAYTAALWSAPIAWNCVPLVGDVRLSIISERVTKQPLHFAPLRTGALPEQLVVRWCTPGKNGSASATTTAQGTTTGKDVGRGFTGLFVFQFDAQGRILSHTIETVQEGGDWERGVGAKVVGLTDWLLGGMRRGGDSPSPAFEGLGKRQ